MHAPNKETTVAALDAAYDVVLVGGGPAGTTAGHYLAQKGHKVLIVERGRHPRFSIGESLLPATTEVWRDLGLLERIEAAGFIRKFGAYFDFNTGTGPEYFHFPDASRAKAQFSYEVPRGEFDEILWSAALEAGAQGIQDTAVREFLGGQDGDPITGVKLRGSCGTERDIKSRLVLDCSGRSTLLAKQLDLRVTDPYLNKVAFYSHYRGAFRSSGEDEGTIAIIAIDEGWLWVIPFAGELSSVGAVVDNAVFKAWKNEGLDREGMWARILEATPPVSRRLAGAEQVRPVETAANFSYCCTQLAGDGWALVGDAGAFLDPVFSAGVHLAMMGGKHAAQAADRALNRGGPVQRRNFAGYERKTRRALKAFSRFIYAWYDPNFQQVFMRPPHNHLGVQLLKRQVISILAGEVFNPLTNALPIQLLRFFAWLKRRDRPRLPEPLETPERNQPVTRRPPADR